MPTFRLDPKLRKDTHLLGLFEGLHLLLMNNRLVPWFILVPETSATELYEMTPELQKAVLKAVGLLSPFVKRAFDAQKLNVASIGNLVSQMHIHVVGRSPEDFCWPAPVWGAQGGKPYGEKEVEKIKKAVEKEFPTAFTPS